MVHRIFGPSRGKDAEFVLQHNVLALQGDPPLLHNADQFRRLPLLWPTLEKTIGFGAMCCVRVLFEVLLTPVRLCLMPWTATRRDGLTMFLLTAGLAPFIATVSSDSPMYLYSYWYHTVRGTSILKLYVIFNMLEVGEKLLASFNHDAAEALWYSLNGTRRRAARMAMYRGDPEAALSQESRVTEAALTSPWFTAWLLVLTAVSTAAHSFVIMLLTVTLNTTLNNDDYSLFALLISNNFVELKSLVFKKATVENMFQHVCTDVVERVQQWTCMSIMLLRHAQSEGFGSMDPTDFVVIIGFESIVDFFKHFFLARFNRISLQAYDSFHVTIVWDAARTYLADELSARVLGQVRRPCAKTTPTRHQQQPQGRAGESDASADHSPAAPSDSAGSSAQTRSHAATRSTLRNLTPVQRKSLRSIHSVDSFVRNPARRIGFSPFAYAAVIAWASTQNILNGISASPVLFVACIASVLLLQSVLGVFIDGTASRYTVRSRRWEKLAAVGEPSRPKHPEVPPLTPSPQAAGMPAGRHGAPPSPLSGSGGATMMPPSAISSLHRHRYQTPRQSPAGFPVDAARADPLSVGGSPTFAQPSPIKSTPSNPSLAGSTDIGLGRPRLAERGSDRSVPQPLSGVRPPAVTAFIGGGANADASGTSSGTTSPQATFVRYMGPPIPPIGASLDTREPSGLLSGPEPAGLHGVPTPDRAARTATTQPPAAPAGKSGGRKAAAGRGPDGKAFVAESVNLLASIEPLDHVYPFQRVDAPKQATQHHHQQQQHHRHVNSGPATSTSRAGRTTRPPSATGREQLAV